MRAIICSVLALATAGPALAAASAPPPNLLAAVVRSVKLDDQKAAQAMTCGAFPGGGRMQQYCSWRVTGRSASFAEIWGAVATQMAPGRWLVTGTPRPAQTQDVTIRSAGPDNGKTTTLEACVRKGGGVEPLGGKTVCNLR